MRRLLILYASCILLAFGVPQSRAFITQQADRPEVQAFLEASEAKRQLATKALWDYAGSATVYLDGKPSTPNTGIVPKTDDYRLTGAGCTLTTDQAEAILKQYNSPAAGYGYAFTQGCNRTKVDNAYVMAMFIHESTAGTAGVARETLSSGNIECTDGNCSSDGRFQKYNDWAAGINAHFDLLKKYADGQGPSGKKHDTIRSALNEWAPPSENDTNGYADEVEQDVSSWRRLSTGKVIKDGEAAETETQASVVAPVGSYEAPALALTGCLGTNVRSAHNSSPGLHEVTIAPGADWSFNEHWVIDDSTLVVCNVYGGGVCNQSSRFSNVARNLGLKTESAYHGYIYDSAVPREDNLAIWSSGSRGGQDLVIRNTTGKTAHIVATIEGDKYIVKGWLDK